MRYRSNGKQVLCDGLHFADAVSESVAKLIADAMNGLGDAAYITAPPDDDEPSLFGLGVVLDSTMPPGVVQFRHPDGRTDTVLVDEPRCSIRQYADQYACATHKTQWDVNDTPPDTCEVP